MTATLRTSNAVEGLPVSVRGLAAKRGMPLPISLRKLLAEAGSRTRKVRIGVLRYNWATPMMGALAQAAWPDTFYEALFNGRNGWSIHDYWWRSTLGSIDLQFNIRPWRVLLRKQADLKGDRNGMVAAARAAAGDDDAPLGSYDHVIAFVHAPPSNAGATSAGGDAVFDQGGSIPFFQHEIGHVIGLEHAFGPTCGDFLDGYAYHDAYCVMGFTGPQSHPIDRPSEAVGVVLQSDGFLESERRPAAATLYRYFEEHLQSRSGFIHTDLSVPIEVTLVALSEARFHDPVLVIARTAHGDVVIEYRVATGDDAGVDPAIVLHSIGRRRTMDYEHENRPAWFEAVLAPTPGTIGSRANDIRVEVKDVSPDLKHVRLRIDKPPSE